MNQTIKIEFYGPEVLKVAAFQLIDLHDGQFDIDNQRRLVFRATASGAVVDTESVAENGSLLVWRYDISQKTLADVVALFPEYDMMHHNGVYHLSGRGQWPYHELRQSYIADFKDAFEHQVGHRVFSRYLRDATIRYLENKIEE